MHLFGAALLSFLLLVGSATAAEELTRTEYKERAEPICKTNVLANKRIFKGAKGEVKAGKLKPASTHFFRAATAFAKTISQLEAVPRPLADEAKLSKWFAALQTEKALIEKIGRALKAEDKRKAESHSVELRRNSNTANNAVLGFDFDYCLIDPSRFG
ncbi:MAG TPA: hypothetical protein VF081_02530 [Solirubrobacterales bacterium]